MTDMNNNKILVNLKKKIIEVRHSLRRLTFGKRLKPSFVIVGAQKAGTTSLYRYLIQHPNIKSSLLKEIPLKIGDKFSDSESNLIIESLFKTGLFSDISITNNEGVINISYHPQAFTALTHSLAPFGYDTTSISDIEYVS